MLWFPLLLACGLGGPSAPAPVPRPDNVPARAHEIRLDADALTLDGKRIDDRANLEIDLVDGIHDPLLNALPTEGDAWIQTPGDTPWMLVRKLIVTANQAGLASRWVSSNGAAYGPSKKPDARFRPHCPVGGYAIEGVSRRISVEIFQGSDGTWVETSAHFAPVVEGAAALSLPQSCWTGASCALVGSHAPTCEAARAGPEAPTRVPIAGAIGCILPIRKEPGDEAAWPDELATNLKGLGITAADEATLVIEANTPWSAVIAVMEGFARAGLPAPALGMPLVEGHGRPPICTATIRDATTLNTAAAKWLGSHLAPAGE